MSPCFNMLFCYFAIWLILLSESKKARKADAFPFQCAQDDEFESSPTEYKGIPKEIQGLSQHNEVSLKKCK